MMMWLDCDERYPDYIVSDHCVFSDVQIEVTENELKQIQAATAAYDDAQEMLANKYSEWKKKRNGLR